MRAKWFKSIVAAGILAGCAAALAAPNPSRDGYQTSVPYAILIEAESGTVLYDKGADQLIAPASLAKLMTAEVVFDQIALGNVSLDEEFVVSTHAWV